MVGHRAGDDASARRWLHEAHQGRLMLQSCQSCLHVQHPPAAVCRNCHSLRPLEWVEHDGHGHLEAATLVHTTPYPERKQEIPFWIASVLLTDGARMICNLHDFAATGSPRPGSCVAWSPELTGERGNPVFTPAADCTFRDEAAP